MKKYKTIVISLGVLILLVGMYFLMGYINKKQEEAKEGEGFMVTELSDVISMEYTDGETTMTFVKQEEKWQVEGQTELVLDDDAVGEIADTLSQIKAARVLSEADEISAYGLDAPKYTVTLKNETGDKITLYIGNSVDEYYYATIGEKVVVYLIESSVVDALEFDIETLQKEESEASE